MEDEGNHGNDETRLFILSSLAQHHKSRINCVLCEDSMLVFDRYPLVDGTFFLSPKRHTSDCIEVIKFKSFQLFFLLLLLIIRACFVHLLLKFMCDFLLLHRSNMKAKHNISQHCAWDA